MFIGPEDLDVFLRIPANHIRVGKPVWIVESTGNHDNFRIHPVQKKRVDDELLP